MNEVEILHALKWDRNPIVVRFFLSTKLYQFRLSIIVTGTVMLFAVHIHHSFL